MFAKDYYNEMLFTVHLAKNKMSLLVSISVHKTDCCSLHGTYPTIDSLLVNSENASGPHLYYIALPLKIH